MTDTQALIISLAKSLLNSDQDYTLYLDNLFNNILLADALTQLKIGVMETARVNAIGLPLSIIQLKNTKESLKWGHLKTAIATSYQLKVWSGIYRTQPVASINCGLWQDNNRVLGKILTQVRSL